MNGISGLLPCYSGHVTVETDDWLRNKEIIAGLKNDSNGFSQPINMQERFFVQTQQRYCPIYAGPFVRCLKKLS